VVESVTCKGGKPQPTQRIVKVRRDYNRLVSDETLEDYALRFTPRSFRKWSIFRVANTAFGAVSFLALEAIGASITLAYGFTNAAWAILIVSLVIFLTGLPIAYRAARHGLDMDLLARGAGFGYLGSTITSLIYAGFTFIFFALEAAIMAQAFELWFGMPRTFGYLIAALVVLPLVTHGITMISRLQLWTQPLWLILLFTPFVAVAIKEPQNYVAFTTFNGLGNETDHFSWAAFGAASTVVASLIAQIGEQVDFLRFMPEPEPRHKARWWLAVVVAGPGWIVLGAAKMLGGAFLTFLALQQEAPLEHVLEPMQMYLVGFKEAVGNNGWAIFLAGLFVIVSQIKINVTNAYAGSLAWSNFFARLTHSHPGRVVWLVFNVLIALLLMMMGVFEALNQVLGLYAHLAVAWVGSVVGNLVISKPLGLSPKGIEFRRAYLYDINPSGFGAMVIASVLSIAAHYGVFGNVLQPASVGIALVVSLLASPLIAWAEHQHYAIARTPVDFGARHDVMNCSICRNHFEAEDIAYCPAYNGPICSLCCTLDARCGDRCKTRSRVHEQLVDLLARWLPHRISTTMALRVWQYVMVLTGMVCIFGTMMWLPYAQMQLRPDQPMDPVVLFWKISAGLVLFSAVAAWWLVLTGESRHVAQEESDRQNQLLQSEIDAHRKTDVALQKAKEEAERANFAKSRFLTGMSHEMRSPLNSIIGYSQLLLRHAKGIGSEHREAVGTIYRSGEHLTSLVDGLLELSRIEAGKMRLELDFVNLREFFDEIVRMFTPQARKAGLSFNYEVDGILPTRVHTDPKRLRQILINLLSNAIKFTECGSVSLRVRHQREIAHIDIEDTGIGIAVDDQERVFMPFERVGAGKSKVDGTGLGLTITQLLVELMGGDIRLHSRRGEGSCFQVRLYMPAMPSVAAADLAEPVCGYVGARRHVLVIDDESAHRGLLNALLNRLGFLVSEAESGADCFKHIAEQRPDLVLLDISLPDMTGWEIARQIHAMGSPRIAIVMVSANAHENTDNALKDGHADGFVVKPVDEGDLLEKIRRALDLQWLRGGDEGWRQSQPDPDVARELLALAAGSFPQALRARLLEVGEEDTELIAWTRHCLGMAQTDMDGLIELLFQATHDHANV
jgi:signal transduction histidine kinase/CheY-like chemotaxis protein